MLEGSTYIAIYIQAGRESPEPPKVAERAVGVAMSFIGQTGVKASKIDPCPPEWGLLDSFG